MEMKKIACAVLVAASAATVAFAAEAPAPAPTSAAPAAVAPAIGAALGATVVSFFAYYLQDMFGQKSAAKTFDILEFVRDNSRVRRQPIRLDNDVNLDYVIYLPLYETSSGLIA
uniref:Uncharacterized protein n=2 Tax=Oryza TaxID=4527 RepID=A0A0E0CQP4_9ORYZ